MLKKYALKVGNSLSTMNYMRPRKGSSSRSSTSDEDNGSRCSCDSNYDQKELNRNLFIENYLIGRGLPHNKGRSSSLSITDEKSLKDVPIKCNNRRKSFLDKRDDRIKINRNQLFHGKNENADHRVRHKISIEFYDDGYCEIDGEKSLNCDIFETSVPTMRKISNILREYEDFELSIVANLHFFR
jgi:hypothetical protein